LLEHTAPLPVPDSEALALALNCLVALSESLRALVLQAYGAPLPSKTFLHSSKRAAASSSTPPPPSTSPSSPKSSSSCGSHGAPTTSGGLMFMPPPPSALVFRSPSEQSLADFLADSEHLTSGEGEAAAGKALGVDRKDDAGASAATPSAHVVSPAQQRQREAVRSFVEAVWENVLSAASQLLVHSHAAAANHRTTTASAAHSQSSTSATAAYSANSGDSSTGHMHSSSSSSSSGGSSHSNAASAGPNQSSLNVSSGSSLNGKGNSNSGSAAVQRRLLDKLLTVYVSFTISAGLGGLQTPRDCFLGSLCKAALPSPWLHSSSSSSSQGYAQDYGGSPQALSPPHVAVLKVWGYCMVCFVHLPHMYTYTFLNPAHSLSFLFMYYIRRCSL
jgi:hypothetical protein